MNRRAFAFAALLVFAASTSAVAQALAPVAERAAAAAAMRAQLAAGTVKLSGEFSDWAVSCITGGRPDINPCYLFTRMLVELEPRQFPPRIAAIAITVNDDRTEASVRIASDAPFPTLARVQVDTLPAHEITRCTPNGCSFVGAEARALIEEFKTGAVVTVLYKAPRGEFVDRLPLESFAAKHADLLRR
jgi:invasion protein IalB